MDKLRKRVIKSIFAAYELAGLKCSMNLVRIEACGRISGYTLNDLPENRLKRIYLEWCVIAKIIKYLKLDGVHADEYIPYAIQIIQKAAKCEEMDKITDADLNRISHEWRRKSEIKESKSQFDLLHSFNAYQN